MGGVLIYNLNKTPPIFHWVQAAPTKYKATSVAPWWPRLMARLQRSAGRRLLSRRIWSTLCCGDSLLDGSIGYLVDVWAIGRHDSWVPYELERLLATWRRDRRESCGDGWLTLRLTADRLTQLSHHFEWTGAIWLAGTASDISRGIPRELCNRHREESRFRLHTVTRRALWPDKYGFLWSVKDADPFRCDLSVDNWWCYTNTSVNVWMRVTIRRKDTA